MPGEAALHEIVLSLIMLVKRVWLNGRIRANQRMDIFSAVSGFEYDIITMVSEAR